jgi:hypothetical protein
MANKQIVFSDRLAGISVQGGTARLDFGVISGAAKSKDGKPAMKLEVTHQLVIPLDAFIQAVGMQDKAVKELVSRAKKRRDAKAGGDAGTSEKQG